MASMGNAKPICGSGKEQGTYDLALHVVGLFLVLGFSILGAGFPVLAKRVKWLRIPPKVFFACKHFGTGVLIATAFVHLLPTAFGSLSDPCLPDLFTTIYPPITGVIMMVSMFCLFVIEMYLNGKTGGHSHGGPTGVDLIPPPTATQRAMAAERPQRPARSFTQSSFDTFMDEGEKNMAQRMYRERMSMSQTNQLPHHHHQSGNVVVDEETGLQNPFKAPDMEMPPWFVVFYEQYVRQRIEMHNMLSTSNRASMYPVETPNGPDKPTTTTTTTSVVPISNNDDPEKATSKTHPPPHWFLSAENTWTDPLVYRKLSLNITILEAGILFHSVFVGMTVSLTIDGFVVLLVAILFHQMFEGLGLGSRIAAVPYPARSYRPWLLVVAFGTTAPLGQAIGLAVRGSYDPNSALGLIIVGVFNAISSGLLIYASLVDLLAEDFLSEEANAILNKKDKIVAFIYVLLGALGMSIVGGFA